MLSELLNLLGRASDDPVLEQFLVEHRVHERPRTVSELVAEGYLAEEELDDDDETDVEYERQQESLASMVVTSERLGFCLIFETRHEYALVHQRLPPGNAPFIVYEVAFFAQGVQIYQQYQGPLPGGLKFGLKKSDPLVRRLGKPIGARPIYEDTQVDLFLIDGLIVNYGFSLEDESLSYVHVRQLHSFDQIMLHPRKGLPQTRVDDLLGGSLIGQSSASPAVQDFLREHGIEWDEDEDEGAPVTCPEEIMDLTIPLGVTVYFEDTAQGQCVSSIVYKRRGDLESQGYTGPLPLGFEFGDAPQTLWKKAAEKHVKQTLSDQLVSFYWPLPSGYVMQAVCSLIDWQLYRVNIHAPFKAKYVLKD